MEASDNSAVGSDDLRGARMRAAPATSTPKPLDAATAFHQRGSRHGDRAELAVKGGGGVSIQHENVILPDDDDSPF